MNSLFDFASGCRFAHHHYLDLDGDRLITSKVKRLSLTQVLDRAFELYRSASGEEKRLAAYSIVSIRERIREKLDGRIVSIARCFFRSSYRELEESRSRLEAVRIADFGPSEPLYRLRFLNVLPNRLKVRDAPLVRHMLHHWRDAPPQHHLVDEPKIIRWISEKVFHSRLVQEGIGEALWNRYRSIMEGIYRGDHILFEDADVSELIDCGAIMRVSSHYEQGREILEWRDGEPVYGGEGRLERARSESPHYGLTGRHIRHILFHSLELQQTEEGNLVFGKTARQVQKLVDAGKLQGRFSAHARRFVALQFEWAKDSEGHDCLGCFFGRGIDFFTHRIFGYLLYRVMRLFGVERANVGAYGWGHTDENPVVLTPFSSGEGRVGAA